MKLSLVLLSFFVAVVVLAQPSQRELDIIRVEMKTEDNARRILQLENLSTSAGNTAARIAVLEDNMFEIKWMSRSVLAALVIQMLLNIRTTKKGI